MTKEVHFNGRQIDTFLKYDNYLPKTLSLFLRYKKLEKSNALITSNGAKHFIIVYFLTEWSSYFFRILFLPPDGSSDQYSESTMLFYCLIKMQHFINNTITQHKNDTALISTNQQLQDGRWWTTFLKRSIH